MHFTNSDEVIDELEEVGNQNNSAYTNFGAAPPQLLRRVWITISNTGSRYGRKPAGLAVLGILLGLCLLGGAVFVGTALFGRNGQQSSEVCTSAVCAHVASQLLFNLDEANDPCDDFYDFACGGFVKRTVVPASATSYSLWSVARQHTSIALKDIIEEAESATDFEGMRMAKIYYKSCMDIESIAKADAEALFERLRQMGGWNFLPNASTALENDARWEAVLATATKERYSDVIISLGIDAQSNDSTKRILNINSGSLLLGMPKYYQQGMKTKHVKAYLKYLTNVAVLFGASEQNASTLALELFDFEKSLAEIMRPVDDAQSRNMSSYENYMTIGEFKQRFNYLKDGDIVIDWDVYLRTITSDALVPLADSTKVRIADPKYFEELKAVVYSQKSKIYNYIMHGIMRVLATYLDEKYLKPHETFVFERMGVSPHHSRWQTCLSEVGGQFAEQLSVPYAEQYFSAEAKDEMTSLVVAVRDTLQSRLETISWLDDQTRRRAVEKVENLAICVGYSDLQTNLSLNMHDLKGLSGKLQQDNYMGNSFLLAKNAFNQALRNLNGTRNRTLPGMTPIQVNAANFPTKNLIDFPAAILQLPFFAPGAPAYFNFGSTGVVAGHEISHGFDDQGAQYDSLGHLHNWWDSESKERFDERKTCFIYQYGNITEPVTGQKLNGINTLGENIADNGGVSLAFEAWSKMRQNSKLPGLQDYSPEQLFFISHANHAACSVQNPESIELRLDDEHSMARYRVNVPLQNTPEFAKAYNCPIGSKMNPKHKCKLW